MTNFIQRLFSKTGKQNDFPKFSIGYRLEDIEYKTETKKLYIDDVDGSFIRRGFACGSFNVVVNVAKKPPGRKKACFGCEGSSE